MKKMITLALLALMVACAPKPQPCELFGVSLGDDYEQVKQHLTERFGGGVCHKDIEITYEDIYHDGLKFSNAGFVFNAGELTYVYATCAEKIECIGTELSIDEIERTWGMVHCVDSILGQRHTVCYNPVGKGLQAGEVVSIAVKNPKNTDDYIAVTVRESTWGYNRSKEIYLELNLMNVEKSF